MELRFSPLFSGSSGNAVYVGCGNTHLLVDAGLSGARVAQALSDVGVDPRSLAGILVTHEHSDHIRGVGILSRKFDLPVYATPGTWLGMAAKLGAISEKNRRTIETETHFFLGDVDVVAFSTPHDALEPCGFRFENGAARFALATDIGCVRESWLKYVAGCDAVLLESNYDPDMLKAGPYPYDLKKRILSRRGHLSNDDAGETAGELIRAGTRQIILGHLSKENNFPELALQTAQCLLRTNGIDPEEDVDLRVARRDAITGLFAVGAAMD